MTEEDYGKILTGSYSKLDSFSCPLSYKLKYKDKNFSKKSNLAMDIGSIIHFGLEKKAQYILKDEQVNYEEIINDIHQGYKEVDQAGKHKQIIQGIDTLDKTYFEDWFALDINGLSYDDKMKIFFEKVLPTRMEEKEWKVLGAEIPFKFVYDDRIILQGFIDRVDCLKKDEKSIKIIDYKTSKKTYPDTKIKTPLQHVIYDLAALFLYDELPIDHEYDFVLIDKKQNKLDGVCSRGYFARGIRKLDSILNKIAECDAEDEFKPAPTPLCYWCPYHSTSPNADPKYKGLCKYHSLWTPTDKNYGVLNPYKGKINMEEEKPKRKLVF